MEAGWLGMRTPGHGLQVRGPLERHFLEGRQCPQRAEETLPQPWVSGPKALGGTREHADRRELWAGRPGGCGAAPSRGCRAEAWLLRLACLRTTLLLCLLKPLRQQVESRTVPITNRAVTLLWRSTSDAKWAGEQGRAAAKAGPGPSTWHHARCWARAQRPSRGRTEGTEGREGGRAGRRRGEGTEPGSESLSQELSKLLRH